MYDACTTFGLFIYDVLLIFGRVSVDMLLFSVRFSAADPWSSYADLSSILARRCVVFQSAFGQLLLNLTGR